VTVCVAALADVGDSIAVACDSMLSSLEFSADKIAHKLYPLSEKLQWAAMISGDDLTHVVPLLETTVIEMFSLTDDTNSLTNVELALTKAYKKVRDRYVQDLILSPIGLDFEVLRNRPKWNPYLGDRLASVSLGCDLLIAGFDNIACGHVLTVEHPGIVRNHDPVGWAAIGSGTFSAAGSLLHHSVNSEMELARVLYHVCEAKFMAESASGVGEHTTAMVIRPRVPLKEHCELSDAFISGIRGDWEREGKPRVPKGTLEYISEQLKKFPGNKISQAD
jgi:hypothetical protein